MALIVRDMPIIHKDDNCIIRRKLVRVNLIAQIVEKLVEGRTVRWTLTTLSQRVQGYGKGVKLNRIGEYDVEFQANIALGQLLGDY